MKKVVLWVLVLCAAVLAFACTAFAEANYRREGHSGDSWDDAYIIDSVDDFKQIGYDYYVNTLRNIYGKYYKLSVDLDLTNETEWEFFQFSGHFDGQNHVIRVNINSINSDSALNTDFAALFADVIGKTNEISTIENLNVEGTVRGARYVSGIAGSLTFGIIENCTFTGVLEPTLGREYNYNVIGAGGIVNHFDAGIIRNCTFNGTVTAKIDAADNIDCVVGGIACATNFKGDDKEVRIENCRVLSGSTLSVSDFSNYSMAGGIVGEIQGEKSYIIDCTSDAVISGAEYIGGIAGGAFKYTRSNISNNQWTGAELEIGFYSNDGDGENDVPDVPIDNNTPTENPNTLELELAPLSSEFEEFQRNPISFYDGEFYGYIPSPIDLSHLANNPPTLTNAVSLAAEETKYDGRQYVPAVRNQNPYGTCWAHAALGSLESSYMRQGLTFLGSSPDLSELHLAWFSFKDPQKGRAFALLANSRSVLNQGGYWEMPVAFLTRMAGAVRESDLPYNRASADDNQVQSAVGSKGPEDYVRALSLQDVYIVGAITDNNRDIVKQLIRDNGAASVFYRTQDSGYSEENGQMAYYDTDGSGHVVLLVGWDDDFPRENFAHRPSHNGAWLARNSWGTGWGDGGYFWMSYEQYTWGAAAYVAGDSGMDLNYYGFDDLGKTQHVNCQWSANVFQVRGDSEILKKVGFYTTDNNAQYELAVYDFGGERPVTTPIKGTPAVSRNGTIPYAGYHTLDLSQSLSLTKGNYFTVVLKMTTKEGHPTAVEEESYNRGAVVINAGESMFSFDGVTWADGAKTSAKSENGRESTPYANACIKAFTTGGTRQNNDNNNDNHNSNNNTSGGSGGGCSAGLGTLGLALALAVFLSMKRK